MSKSEAKMVNATFALPSYLHPLFFGPCKCGIYHFCPYLPGVNLSKSIFPSSDFSLSIYCKLKLARFDKLVPGILKEKAGEHCCVGK